jgi:hypothetical protein
MISFENDAFDVVDEYTANESIEVRSSQREEVTAALNSAAPRMMLVDETGVEHPPGTDVEELIAQDLYTPNFVGEPDPTRMGVRLYVDCKGQFGAGVSATFRRIVREELERAGVAEATVVNAKPFDSEAI